MHFIKMPPQRKQKSPAEKKEEAERKKRILAAKEKILSTKRSILEIVESAIEKDVPKEWFLSNCVKLCHADYDDVVQERSIEHLCGYPLCSNIIKQMLKQKYHISRVTNKVYDLTERKYFCSNQCYKASNYLRAQLSPIPLHMRKEETITVHLLLDSDNKGSAGEEVLFHHKISSDEINDIHKMEETSNSLRNMLNEEVKICADSLSELKIKERVFDKEFVFSEETPKRKSDSSLLDDKDESYSDKDDDSDDSSDETLFPSYDNMPVLCERHMPIPQKIKKTVLIPPQQQDTNHSSPVQKLSLDFVIKVFEDWMTEDSMKYLLGEKYVYGVKAEHLFETMTANDPLHSEKLEAIKKEYINLCLKIDSLQDYDEEITNDALEFEINESRQSSSGKKIEVKDNPEKKVFKSRPKKKSNDTGKCVTFASEPKTENEPSMVGKVGSADENTHVQIEQVDQIDEKNSSLTEENVEELPTDSSPPEASIPLVDSVSQNILRRQVVINKLKPVYTEVLPVAGLHYTNIREAVRKFIDTLSLSPTNITFKPKEWKLISIVLLRVLTRTVLKDIYDELQFLKLYEHSSMPIAIDFRELERIVHRIISEENILNVQSYTV